MTDKPKPVIGITGPVPGGTAAWLATALSVILAGGHPLRITTEKTTKAEDLDGLIVGGGADIDPGRYGEQLMDLGKDSPSRSFYRWIFSILFFPVYWLARKLFLTKSPKVDHKRDEMELYLIQEMTEENKPVMGICRGMQLINISFGGSLHQDIANFYTEKTIPSSIFPLKKVTIEEESKLSHILGRRECIVNALHHQAIKEPGEGIRITAKESPSGITQGIEHTHLDFVIGVQWHPEYLIQIREQRQLFRQLVEAASVKMLPHDIGESGSLHHT